MREEQDPECALCGDSYAWPAGIKRMGASSELRKPRSKPPPHYREDTLSVLATMGQHTQL